MLIDSRDIALSEKNEKIVHISLDNESGIRLKITNYGGIITHLYTPDRDGIFEDVVLGFEKPEDYFSDRYKEDCAYFGAITGRYCNRISHGKFKTGSGEYRLETNSGIHHIHGGYKGFDKVVWKTETFIDDESASVLLSHFSPDGDQGYPGNMKVQVRYTLTAKNEVIIDYRCVSDKPTPVNLTNHSYFNLSGNFKRDVLDHEVMIPAKFYTENDKTLIPTGRILPVAGSLLDFRNSSLIRNKLATMPGGFDHNFVLEPTTDQPVLAARMSEKASGRMLEVYTTEPGLQFFTLKSGNFPLGIKKRIDPGTFSGIALEPQHFPDSPNHPHFPDTIIRPGEIYKQRSIYKFSTEVSNR